MDFDKQLEAMRRKHVLHIDDGKEYSDDLDELSEMQQQSSPLPEPTQGAVLLYQSDDQNISVSVYFYNETFWMNQKAMAELFECSSDNIAVHLKIFILSKNLTQFQLLNFSR